MTQRFWTPVFISLLFWIPSHALSLEVPAHTGLVVDLAQVMSPPQQTQLEGSLRQFQKEYGPQLQVLTIPSLEGENLESYSIKVAETWKLGDAKRDDGLLLLVAVADRAARIEVGQGLEGVLPDILAGRIVRDIMIPYFKEGHYYAGIVAALNASAGRIGGTLKDVPTIPVKKASGRSSPFGILFFFIFLFFILPRFFGGGGRRGQRGRDLATGFIIGDLLGSRRRGGGGFGDGGFGGGFGGGGGGGFSGGGASGRW